MFNCINFIVTVPPQPRCPDSIGDAPGPSAPPVAWIETNSPAPFFATSLSHEHENVGPWETGGRWREQTAWQHVGHSSCREREKKKEKEKPPPSTPFTSQRESYSAVTDEDGRFRIPNVRVGGPYTVTASLSSFRDERIENVNIALGEDRPLNSGWHSPP